MRKICRFLDVLLILVMMFQPSCQHISDMSFINYCSNRAGGELTLPISTNTKPTGGTCRFQLQLPTQNNEDAEEHCSRYSIHHLKSAKKDGDFAECIVDNLYSCRVGYTQIRGMCYRKMSKREVSFEEAKKMCKNDNANILKIDEMMFGMILEDQMDQLTRYFIEPNEHYDKWVTFSGGVGPNYVILFNDANHYGTGANSIIRLAENKKADVMCMYQPEENVVSVAVKAEKLGRYYYPSVLTNKMSVWRTSGLYTKTNLPNHDVCEAMMKAIIGSNSGTFIEMHPQQTQQLSTDLRESFIQAYVSFYDCLHENVYRVYFKRKDTPHHDMCMLWPLLTESDYKANFHVGQHRYNPFSYVYYGQTVGGYDIEGRLHAIHGPMLCGLYHIPQNIPRFKCDLGWEIFERKPDQFICHKFFYERRKGFELAKGVCADANAKISRWESFDEMEAILKLSNAPPNCSQKQCGPWVGCHTKTGCTEYEFWNGHYPFMGFEEPGYCEQHQYGHVVCEKAADPI